MKLKIERLIILSSVLCISIILMALLHSSGVAAQKYYVPSVTYIGDQSSNSSDNLNTYKVNENGERYGSAKYIDIGLLDLVLAKGTNGVIGYVKAADLEEPLPKSPEEAANWKTSDRTNSLYAADGTTIIGEFIIQGNEDNNVVIYK